MCVSHLCIKELLTYLLIMLAILVLFSMSTLAYFRRPNICSVRTLLRLHPWTSPCLYTSVLKQPVGPSIITFTVNSKFDYCNSLYCNLPNSQIVYNASKIISRARTAVVKAAEICHVTCSVSSPVFQISWSSYTFSHFRTLTTTRNALNRV